MIKFYGYKRCSTSRSAQKWLTEQHVEITFQDLVEQPPTKNELIKWLTKYQDRGLKYFFNTHGQDYRQLHLKDKISTMSISEAAELMSQNGKLIKRPLVVSEQNLTCGFNEEVYQETWLTEQA